MSSLTAILATAVSSLMTAVIPSALLVVGYNLLSGTPLDISEAAGVYLITSSIYLMVTNAINMLGASRAASTLLSGMLGKGIV